jgi:hypothetical protein
MSLPDKNIPSSLLEIQRWFGSIINKPLEKGSSMSPVACSGRPIEEEAADFILPSSRMKPHRRMEIYNQQYWWRLLSSLQENFPLLARLFGYEDFNHTIAIPFLTEYPSSHWSLEKLGERLPHWIGKNYPAKDRILVLYSAQIDLAYQELFVAPIPKPLHFSTGLLAKKIELQPHVKLFKLPFHLFVFRQMLLKEAVDYWTDVSFPHLPLDKEYFFLLYRTHQNSVIYREVDESHYLFLHLLSSGSSMEEVCIHLESTCGLLYTQAKTSLMQWAQLWNKENFLC